MAQLVARSVRDAEVVSSSLITQTRTLVLRKIHYKMLDKIQ